jgi:hypothetical protein
MTVLPDCRDVVCCLVAIALSVFALCRDPVCSRGNFEASFPSALHPLDGCPSGMSRYALMCSS